MRWVAALAALFCAGAALALEPLRDSDLGTVSGQEGIALGLQFDINAAANGTPLASLGSCTGTTTANGCRLAIKLENRTDQWLIVKDYFGNLLIPQVNLDAGTLGQAASDTTQFDDTRFRDDAGTCLLPGGSCTTATLDGMLAMRISYPVPTTSYTPATGVSSGYTSASLALNVGRMAVEYGATGYLGDAKGSFLGVKIGDNSGTYAPAGIAYTGTTFLYGF